MSRPEPVHEISLEHDGVTHNGVWWLAEGGRTVYVRSGDHQKCTWVRDRVGAESLARLLLSEIARGMLP
jgi:hypothetical protein